MVFGHPYHFTYIYFREISEHCDAHVAVLSQVLHAIQYSFILNIQSWWAIVWGMRDRIHLYYTVLLIFPLRAELYLKIRLYNDRFMQHTVQVTDYFSLFGRLFITSTSDSALLNNTPGFQSLCRLTHIHTQILVQMKHYCLLGCDYVNWEIYQSSGGTYCHRLQGWRVSHATYYSYWLLCLLFDPEEGSSVLHRNICKFLPYSRTSRS
jgi:hypothetical protein